MDILNITPKNRLFDSLFDSLLRCGSVSAQSGELFL